MLGVNILQPAEKKFGHGVFGDLEVSYDNGEEVASAFVDVCVTESGLLCGADATRGRLFLYDADCNLVAIWGGSGSAGAPSRPWRPWTAGRQLPGPGQRKGQPDRVRAPPPTCAGFSTP